MHNAKQQIEKKREQRDAIRSKSGRAAPLLQLMLMTLLQLALRYLLKMRLQRGNFKARNILRNKLWEKNIRYCYFC